MVIPQFTWQAYNFWNNSSLYSKDANGKPIVHKVSFSRPYLWNAGLGLLLSNRASHELEVLRWLESRGYDVAYASDVDLVPDTIARQRPKVLLFAGHDEYWTWSEYNQVENLRDQGTHLMFLAGDDASWNVRMQSGAFDTTPTSVVVCYKSLEDPEATSISTITAKFHDHPLNRPSNQLIGVIYHEQAAPGLFPLVVSDTAMGPEATAFLTAAGLGKGDTLSDLVGDEGDAPFWKPPSPDNLQVLFRSPNRPNPGPTNHFYTTFFIARSGAGVFAAGNLEFARGLDNFLQPANPRLQALIAAVLDWMLAH